MEEVEKDGQALEEPTDQKCQSSQWTQKQRMRLEIEQIKDEIVEQVKLMIRTVGRTNGEMWSSNVQAKSATEQKTAIYRNEPRR